MLSNMRRFVAIIAIGSGFMLPLNRAVAEEVPLLKNLSALWVQWHFRYPHL
jgi:hypothetical protein